MIISITATSNREKIIGDAIKSVVSWVDIVLIINLIDPSVPIDNTLTIAKDIAGKKLRIVNLNLRDSLGNWIGMDEIRNFGIEEATKLGGTWAVQLDTDERILLNNIDIRMSLKSAPKEITTFTVFDDLGSYDKYRFQRLPTTGKYINPVHEEWHEDNNRTHVLSTIRFHEIPKTPEQLKDRLLNSDLPGLLRQIEKEPTNHRWFYYLGVTHENLEQYIEALEYYRKTLPLAPNHPVNAWICFRIASVLYKLKKYNDSLEWCTKGLIHGPEYAELLWLAGIQCLNLSRYDTAIYWEKLALSQSWIGSPRSKISRVGFKDIQAFFEGPYAVMAEAYKLKNENALETWAKKQAMRALKEKEIFMRGI